jgi:predicted Zn-ribbon and HTH transcriptional regulator
MSISAILAAYVLVTLGALAAVAVFYSLRERRFGPSRSGDRLFRCGKCGYVYTDDPDVDRSRCPQCRCLNDAFRF